MIQDNFPGVPLLSTPAIILHVMPYGDTSKILRLLTREAGLMSGIARGARRARAGTGPRLDIFAAGNATLITKPNRDLHPLTGFEISSAHAALGRDVERFAAASAMCELTLRCAPAEPHPEIHDALAAGLEALEHADAPALPAVAVLAVWGLVVALGFAPTLDRCVVCGAPPGASLAFSPAQGGALCALHRAGTQTATLQHEDAEALRALTKGRLPAEPLGERHAAAHRRLLLGFIRHHLAEHREMPALAFWNDR